MCRAVSTMSDCGARMIGSIVLVVESRDLRQGTATPLRVATVSAGRRSRSRRSEEWRARPVIARSFGYCEGEAGQQRLQVCHILRGQPMARHGPDRPRAGSLTCSLIGWGPAIVVCAITSRRHGDPAHHHRSGPTTRNCTGNRRRAEHEAVDPGARLGARRRRCLSSRAFTRSRHQVFCDDTIGQNSRWGHRVGPARPREPGRT